MHDAELGRLLVKMARRAIRSELRKGGNVGSARAESGPPPHPALAAPGATFVTLFKHGMLRGCIGSIEPSRPLGVDVRANAVAAAFGDPRFPRLRADEFQETTVEVSLLSPPEAMMADDERALLLQLRPGIDGVVLAFAGRRATFLPQVWDSLREPAVFFAELKRKAGLPVDFWSAGVKVSRYGVTKWREVELRAAERMS